MPTLLGYASLVLATVLWGSSFIAGKLALGAFSFPVLVTLRFLISAGLLAALVPRRRALVRVALSPPVLLLGFLTVTATFLLQFGGLALTTATNATVVIGFEPLMVPLVGALAFRERFPLPLAAFGLLALVGVALVVGLPTAQGLVGIGLVLLSTVVVGFWVVLTKRLLKNRTPLEATALTTWGGLVSLVPTSLGLLPFTGPGAGLQDSGATALGALVFLAVVCTLGASFLWNWGLQRVASRSSGIFLAIEPVVGVLLAGLVLGEPLTVLVLLGTGLVLAAAVGAVVTERRPS